MKVLQDIIVPLESVNDQTLIVLELLFNNGDFVKKGSLVAELETSKTTIGIENDYDGYIHYSCKTGDELAVSALIARITDEKLESDKIPDILKENLQHELASSPVIQTADETVFSKNALSLITSSKITKDVFKGRDFVNKGDVEIFLGGGVLADFEKTPIRSISSSIPVDLEKVEFKKIASNKRREIDYLSSVQSAGLRSTVNIQVDTNGVLDYVNHYLSYFRNSLLPVIIYESGKLLAKHKDFNAYFSDFKIAFYRDVHIGFAVDIGKGLKVLRISNTDQKTIRVIEEEIFKLSNDYLDDRLTSDSLTDITFTITDLSSEGVFSFTPLINMKNSSILGISSIDKHGLCMLSLSFDHRVTEGKQAAVFLRELKERVESYISSAYNESYKIRQLSKISCYKCFKKITEDLSEIGFAKCVTLTGDEAYICQSCFKGF